MIRIILVLFFAIFSQLTFGQIENIIVSQQDSLAVIEYELLNKEASLYDVEVFVSKDSLNNFEGPLKTVSGDVGKNISYGVNKKIIWNVLADKEQLIGNYAFKIIASRAEKIQVRQCEIQISIKKLDWREDQLLVRIEVINDNETIQSYFGGQIYLKDPTSKIEYIPKSSFLAGKEGSNPITLQKGNTYNGTLAFDGSFISKGDEFELHMNLPNSCRENNFILPIKIN